MTTNQKWLLGIFLGGVSFFGLILFAGVIIILFGDGGSKISDSFGEKIGILEINGVIEDSEEALRIIKTLGNDDDVKAVVVRINSPGGGVAASQEIYHALLKLKTAKSKPVIASMSSVAASGGYYIALAADQIFASEGTLTGSIGVILEFPDLQGIFKKVGIGMEVIKSAEHKDIGSPFRDLSDTERDLLQEMVDDVFDQFVEAVIKNRGMNRQEVLSIADGRIFSGRQALKFDLIDKLGGLQAAINAAGQLSDLGDNPKTTRPGKKDPSLLDLLNESAASLKNPAAMLSPSPRLLYLFR